MEVKKVAYCYAEYVPMLKAISDETRLMIVDMLSCGELCACAILEKFNFTQPTLSYHMKILTKCGIVVGRRDGAWMNYSLNPDKINDLIKFMSMISSPKDDCICHECKSGKKQKFAGQCKSFIERGLKDEQK
ncbi:MAG: ArsR/SmtB family transcription factor [Burkholderiales bacterium]